MKKALITALISGSIFAVLMSAFDHFGDDNFSLLRSLVYFFFFSFFMTLVNFYSERKRGR